MSVPVVPPMLTQQSGGFTAQVARGDGFMDPPDLCVDEFEELWWVWPHLLLGVAKVAVDPDQVDLLPPTTPLLELVAELLIHNV